ncbi:MAG: hypothetical protein A4E55_01381 [Pelotomaculum sp. PtaU1.Bin035]|nr:MAG: hypothetical protein A4E55_01381 [Pelotomaculum sp. PtaU1.Bin035]
MVLNRAATAAPRRDDFDWEHRLAMWVNLLLSTDWQGLGNRPGAFDSRNTAIRHERETTGTPLTVIGRLTGAGEGVVAVTQGKQGHTVAPLPAKGYDHFTND